MTGVPPYTAQLQAGLGLVDETRALLDLWSPGMSARALEESALRSGLFSTMTARRLRNIVKECFAPRFLVGDAAPARHLKLLKENAAKCDVAQLMFLFTCRANPILADFVREVYWARYQAGQYTITNAEARSFVARAIEDGKTTKPWSDSVLRRVAAYLTGCCADYGLLEAGLRKERRILPYRISPITAAYLSYDLHFRGMGDPAVVSDPDWALFGMSRQDVLEELKRLSLRGLVIVQAAGEIVRVSWKQPSMEALCDVIA